MEKSQKYIKEHGIHFAPAWRIVGFSGVTWQLTCTWV